MEARYGTDVLPEAQRELIYARTFATAAGVINSQQRTEVEYARLAELAIALHAAR